MANTQNSLNHSSNVVDRSAGIFVWTVAYSHTDAGSYSFLVAASLDAIVAWLADFSEPAARIVQEFQPPARLVETLNEWVLDPENPEGSDSFVLELTRIAV